MRIASALARIPIRWAHLIDKNTRQLNMVEHVLIRKVGSTFRGHALALAAALVATEPAVAVDATPPQASDEALDLSHYKLTFEDNFHKLDVSPYGPGTRWIAHTPWNGDFGDARFANPKPGFPFTTDGEGLRIEARKEADGKWSSGMLASTDPLGHGFSQEYGYFEIRAKLPPGPGLWPAFWLIGNKGPGASSEIDVFEYLGHDPTKYEATVHVWPKKGVGRSYEAKLPIKVEPDSLTKDFHTYGVRVDPDWLTFYLDRHEVARSPTPPEHKRPLFLLISLALGSGFPTDDTPNPSYMYVSYVRAYAKEAANPPAH